jgi:predicted transcriptional regulator
LIPALKRLLAGILSDEKMHKNSLSAVLSGAET